MGAGDPPHASTDDGPQARLRMRESPARRVYLDEYWMAKTPVTRRAYQQFLRRSGYAPQPFVRANTTDDGGTHPAYLLAWEDAAAFCLWLSDVTGERYCLPTEAQWEKAARGVDGRTYPWGDELPVSYRGLPDRLPTTFRAAYPWGEVKPQPDWRCNCADCVGHTTPVDAYPASASPFGCLDMAGNVWEWCADWFDPTYYHNAPPHNPMGPETGLSRVVRGGAYNSDPATVRCAARFYDNPRGAPFFPCGFRVVRRP